VFCDVDETIINAKSLLGFLETAVIMAAGTDRKLLENQQRLAGLLTEGLSREQVNAAFYRLFLADRSVRETRDIARVWFETASSVPGFFRRPALEKLASLRAAGTRIVLVTGSFAELIAPVADRVGARDVIAASLERAGDRFTGALTTEPTIGLGKARAVRAYAERTGIALAECCGMADDITDLPFLELLAENFVPVDGDERLLAVAAERGWNTISG
jgi:HAD superfamily hydrolase (TIGR01490 family)